MSGKFGLNGKKLMNEEALRTVVVVKERNGLATSGTK